MSGSHGGGFTCAQVDEGSQDMAGAISRLLEELRGEREKYRQVVEINNANERAYLAKTDTLRAELATVKEQCNRQEHGFAQRESLLQRDLVAAQAGEQRWHKAWKHSCQQTDALRAELGPVFLACTAIPDITISKWACEPGGHWNPVREALRARRAAQGLDVDAADPETAFDEHGWLKCRAHRMRSVLLGLIDDAGASKGAR